MNWDLIKSVLGAVLTTTKLGGYVRAGVASLFTMVVAKWAVVGIIVDPTTQDIIGGVVATIVVGAWSHFVKSSDQQKAAAVSTAKRVAPVLLVIVMTFSVAGCTTWNKVYSAATGATIDTSTVYIAGNTFDAVLITATKYLILPKCGKPGSTAVCRDPKATAAMVPAVRSAYKARAALVQYSIDHPGQLGPQGLYDALKAAGTTLADILDQYNIKVN